MRRCDADEHFYDESKHSECPYCRKTIFTKDGVGERSANEKTVGIISRQKATSRNKSETRVLYGSQGVDEQEELDRPPVVGWLVVIDGPGKGNDLRITAGLNRIGRDDDMNIQVDFGDEAISRQEHTVIMYSPKNNIFRIKHGSGQNLTFLNGDDVFDATTLQAHDKIEMGETTFLFVPLCTEQFTWAK